MKRTSCLLLILALLLPLLPLDCAFAAEESGFIPDVDITAKSVYLYNIDTGSVIYEKDAHVPMAPASMTKIMTAILALESTEDLDLEEVEYPLSVQDELWVYRQEYGSFSHAGMMAGDTLTMRDCLYALLLPSANEVAMNIALHISGSQEEFAIKMNQRAKELGALNTNFTNANGLYDPNHKTTAYDIAQMALHARELPNFIDIVKTPSWIARPVSGRTELVWQNTNKMQFDIHPYVVEGIKTGFLEESGYCLVSTATKGGYHYLLVVMGCGEYVDGKITDTEMHFVDSTKLYDWVFDAFQDKLLLTKGSSVHGVALRLSVEKDQVKLMAGEDFSALLPKDIEPSDISYVMYTPDEFAAPVKKGDPAGEVALILSGEEIGRVPLVIAENVEASPMLILLEKTKEIMRSFWFKFVVIFLILLILLYFVLMILRNRRRKRNGYKPRRRM